MMSPSQRDPRPREEPPRPAVPVVRIDDRRLWVLVEPIQTGENGLAGATVARPVDPPVVHQAGRRLSEKA
jgi:hypothetical protein